MSLMPALSTQLSAIDASIAAINAQIVAVSAYQGTSAEAPEVLQFSIGEKSTQFVGPDRVANAIKSLADALLNLSKRRDAIARAVNGRRFRRTGVAPC